MFGKPVGKLGAVGGRTLIQRALKLSLNFTNGSPLDPRITFTRASSATRTNSAGLIEAVATDAPRFDYSPAGVPLGLLIEEQRTNLALDSGEVFSGTGGVVVANQITAPDGSLADFFQEDTNTSEHYAGDRAPSVAAGTTYTWSFYAKLGLTGEVRRVSVRTGGQGPASVIFDLETGSSTVVAPVVSSGISSAGNGWFRCWIVYTATGTGVAVFRQQLSKGLNTIYAGNGTSGLYLWGAQLEVGAFPTSYIPTVASQVTRTADIALMTGANFSSWYNQTEGTFVVAGDCILATGPSVFLIAQIAGGNDRHQIGVFTPTTATVNADVVQANIGSNTMQSVTTAYAYKTNDFATSSGGNAAATDAVGTVPVTLTYATLGKFDFGGGTSLNGHIRRLTYYATRLPNATLQALSA